jgi:Peptidase A4 family
MTPLLGISTHQTQYTGVAWRCNRALSDCVSSNYNALFILAVMHIKGDTMRKTLKVGLYLLPLPVIAAALIVAVVLTLSTPTRAAAASATHITQHTAPRIHLAQYDRYSTSTNWSGYATTGTKYTDVKGTWTEPSASCSAGQTAYSSFWVGIDGDTTNTVEQTGTDADCSSGTPKYYAWYEMYPKFPVNLSNSVAPGDTLTAEVSTNGSGSFTLTITDTTARWTFTTKQSSRKAKLGSAEWIAEAPSGSGGVLPLADFVKVSFSNCTANGFSISSNPNPDEIVMETTGGVVKAQPSGLSGGTSFSVTWEHS